MLGVCDEGEGSMIRKAIIVVLTLGAVGLFSALRWKAVRWPMGCDGG